MNRIREAFWTLVWVIPLAIFWTLVVVALAHAYTRVTPYRPNGCDLSLRWTNATYADAWCELCGNVHTCSNYERDLKEEFASEQAVQAVELLATLCPQEYAKAWSSSYLNDLYPRLMWPYEARSLFGGGTFSIQANGHHYSIERNTFALLRGCVTQQSKRAQAALLLGSALTLREILDLNQDLTGPSTDFKFTIPEAQLPTTLDSSRTGLAPVDSRSTNNAKQLRLEQRVADLQQLGRVDAAHAMTVCGVSTPTLNVKLELLAFEGLCGSDETCMHARFMVPFDGGCDPRWNDYDKAVGWAPGTACCKWKAITHVFFHRWVNDWPAGANGFNLRQDSQDHRNAHICMNYGANPVGDPGPQVAFSCTEHPDAVPQCIGPDGTSYGSVGTDCRSALPFLMKKLGL